MFQLPEIIRTIVLLHLENEMPCFDLRNVIFITNKWDTLYSEDYSSDEDEETKTWNTLKFDIKNRWPSVREELIFKMNLKDVIIYLKKKLKCKIKIMNIISLLISTYLHNR